MGTRRVTKAGAVSVARVQALDAAEGLDSLTSTATADVVAGDGSGGWQRTAISSLVAAGRLAGASFFDAAGETATANELTLVSCDDEDAAITVDLPSSPTTGDTVWLANVSTEDYAVTAGRNGNTINGSAADFTVGGVGSLAVLTYDGTTWRAALAGQSPQVSGAEITAGTTTALRAYSVADVVSLITTHAAAPATVSQVDAEAGTSTTVYSWTPERVAQAIAALAGGGGPGEYFLTNIFNSGFTSAGGSTPTNNWGTKINWDTSWRSTYSTFEIKCSGYKIGSAVARLHIRQGSTTYWSPTFSLTSIATGTTSVATLAASSMPSGSGVLDVIFDSTGSTTIGNISLWGIL